MVRQSSTSCVSLKSFFLIAVDLSREKDLAIKDSETYLQRAKANGSALQAPGTKLAEFCQGKVTDTRE
ncbi:MAG: hypothetical protein C5B47_00185 [Verrucomicrobia bacterium]|nr:MAG: hypothetical protein C5B47_00185 [Verrucomicrobiota bacterium]